jgi:hypothetical protein
MSRGRRFSGVVIEIHQGCHDTGRASERAFRSIESSTARDPPGRGDPRVAAVIAYRGHRHVPAHAEVRGGSGEGVLAGARPAERTRSGPLHEYRPGRDLIGLVGPRASQTGSPQADSRNCARVLVPWLDEFCTSGVGRAQS